MYQKQISKVVFSTAALLYLVIAPTVYGEEKQKPSETRQELYIGAGSGGGFTALFGEAVAEVIRRSNRSWSVTSSAGEIASNIKFIHDGKMQLTIGYPEYVSEANRGIGVYKEPMPDVKIVANYTTKYPAQFLLAPNVPINSIKEWKEKKTPIRINVQKKGSGAEILNRRLLQAYGVTYEDIKSWGGTVRHEGGSNSFGLIRDGLLDVSLFSGDCPSSAVKEVSSSRKLRMLPIDATIVDDLVKNYGYMKYTIRAGTYDWLKTDIQTLAEGCCLAASTKLAPGVVRDIIRAHIEQLEYLRAVHVSLKPQTEDDLADIAIDLIHPEAREYYESRGIKFK